MERSRKDTVVGEVFKFQVKTPQRDRTDKPCENLKKQTMCRRRTTQKRCSRFSC